jgi:hypothetical protein
MTFFGLAAVVWTILAGLLLFGLLVVVRFAITLFRQAKSLGEAARESGRRLRKASEAAGVGSIEKRRTDTAGWWDR